MQSTNSQVVRGETEHQALCQMQAALDARMGLGGEEAALGQPSAAAAVAAQPAPVQQQQPRRVAPQPAGGLLNGAAAAPRQVLLLGCRQLASQSEGRVLYLSLGITEACIGKRALCLEADVTLLWRLQAQPAVGAAAAEKRPPATVPGQTRPAKRARPEAVPAAANGAPPRAAQQQAQPAQRPPPAGCAAPASAAASAAGGAAAGPAAGTAAVQRAAAPQLPVPDPAAMLSVQLGTETSILAGAAPAVSTIVHHLLAVAASAASPALTAAGARLARGFNSPARTPAAACGC